MKLLELFAGSRSIGKQAELAGIKVLSCDKFISQGIDLVCGVEDLTRQIIVDRLGGEPNIIHASPVCSAWSKTGWFHYWDTDIYKFTKQFIATRADAYESVEMVRKTIEIFSWFPDAVFFMENPEGMLQKHPVLSYFKVYGLAVRRHLVTYCQYGDTVRKPTHIWSNSKTWSPRPVCNRGDNCHTVSPRSTKLGVNSKKGSYERSKIPDELCAELISSCIGTFIPDQYKMVI